MTKRILVVNVVCKLVTKTNWKKSFSTNVKIFVCHYYEREFKIEDVKTFWCEFVYQAMENPFLIMNFC